MVDLSIYTDYMTVITKGGSKPMYLKAVEATLHHGGYDSFEPFLTDLSTIWSNSWMYTKPRTADINRMADHLHRLCMAFKSEWLGGTAVPSASPQGTQAFMQTLWPLLAAKGWLAKTGSRSTDRYRFRTLFLNPVFPARLSVCER